MRFPILVVFIAALANAGGSYAETPLSGPVTLITTLYRHYAWEAVIEQPDLSSLNLFKQPRSVLARYFDEHLAQLILQDQECVKATHEVCRLDFSPMWASQDPQAADLVIEQTAQSTIVSVQFRYPGSGKIIKLAYRLSQTFQGWRISNIRGASFSLLSVLSSKM